MRFFEATKGSSWSSFCHQYRVYLAVKVLNGFAMMCSAQQVPKFHLMQAIMKVCSVEGCFLKC